MKFTTPSQKRIICSAEVISIGIQHLEGCINLDLNALGGLWNKDQWEYELSNYANLCFGIILEGNPIAVTSACLTAGELNITALAVDKSFRRNGLGSKLLSHLLDEAKKSGAKNAILEVKSTNQSAKYLYKSLNFEVVGNRKNYYRDGSDALLFKCNLNN